MATYYVGLGIIVILCGMSTLYLIYQTDYIASIYCKDCLFNQGKLLHRLIQFQRALHREHVPEQLKTQLEEIIESLESGGSVDTQTEISPTTSERSAADRNENRFQLLEVCPEKWGGRGDNLYYLDTWKTEKCNDALPFSSVLSILLYPSHSVSGSCLQQISNVLRGVKKTYDNLPVLVAHVDNFCKYKHKSPHIRYIYIPKPANPGQVWNLLVRAAMTPYVLIGRDMDNFMWFSDLKRPVRILSNSKTTKIAGGAVRNGTGHWRLGCYQSSLRNYILEYQEGYYRSRNDCMYCDYLSGPFVARTEFMKTNPFNESLPREILFEDYFLNLSQSHHTVVNCPDVMYFASDPKLETMFTNRSKWLPLVRKWELNRIVVPDRHPFSYSCEESGSSCNIKKLVESFLMPTCCIEQFVEAAVIMDEFCRRHNIPYELAGGTLMGIVKMGAVMPWDHDGDLFYLGNYTVFSDYKREFEKRGVRIGNVTFVSNEYRWTYFTPDIDIDMSGCAMMSYDSLEDEMFQEFPTQALFHGHWMYVMPNPGGYSRNNYGYETLKHAHHFRSLNQEFKMPYHGGNFKECVKPLHHACLDRFSTDGGLQFKIPNGKVPLKCLRR